jgi:hypothetical protein
MQLFKSSTMTWWQMGVFKVSLLSIGAAAGAYWHEAFEPYTLWLVILGGVLGIYTAFAWFKK